MLLAAEYPLLDIIWTMVAFFAWVAWIWVVFTVLGDIFRRGDIGGWAKAFWTLFVIAVPFLGVFVYLVAEHEGMQERAVADAKSRKDAFDDYVRQAAGGPASEIAHAKELLDAGTISQAEFDAIKAKALS